MAGASGLVGTVDIETEAFDLVQVEYLDPDGAQPDGRCVRARDGGTDPVPVLAESIDEEVHRGAGAYADDRAVLDVIQSRLCCAPLLCITFRRHRHYLTRGSDKERTLVEHLESQYPGRLAAVSIGREN